MPLLHDIWSMIVWMFFLFAFVAYIYALFAIISDIFRDHTLGGWGKALWVIALIFFPIISALIYLIARGDGMAQRTAEDMRNSKAAADAYIRQTAATASPAEQIQQAKSLLEAGVIDETEFKALKAKALS